MYGCVWVCIHVTIDDIYIYIYIYLYICVCDSSYILFYRIYK